MVPFAGWSMPVQYADGIIAEHNHTRQHAAIFDICHMGEFIVKGNGAAASLDHILARPVYNQQVGVCRYNFLLNPDGKVMDDLIVYRMGEEEFFIVVNAGTRYGDAEQISSNLPEGIEFTDVSDSTAKLDLQGPESAEVLVEAGLASAALPDYFHWTKTVINSVPCLLSRTGYTGELGFELYFDADKAVEMWQYLLTLKGVKPAGLGARDTLRLEMGYALYGHELNLATTPIEAGYADMLKLDANPARNFIGKNALTGDAPAKKLVGIALDGRRAAREGAIVFSFDGCTVIGKVTSGAFAPSLGVAVAMAYVNMEAGIDPGSKVILEAGRTQIPGTVCELPFYKNGSVRKKL